MKILVAIMGIDPASGGPTRSCKGLCRSVAGLGVDVCLYVLHGRHPFENSQGVKVVYASDISVADFVSQINDFDLVHLQGIWDWGLHKLAVACRKYRIPYVISPRGMLDPWALSVKKWKKKLAMFLYQRSDLRGAAAFHVTAEMERDHVRTLGYRQPCIIAPNGVDVPEALPKRSEKNGVRTAIFMGRLHSGKGLLTLAEAWAKVRPQGWVMRVVGPDSYGHKDKVVARLEELGIRDQWQFEDMVDDVRKWQEYCRADIMIHPSISENFGITIAEGLYAGLPVVATKGTPWKDLMDFECGLWIDVGAESLAAAIKNITALPASRINEMGSRGRSLVESKYTWAAIGRKIVDGYHEVISAF